MFLVLDWMMEFLRLIFVHGSFRIFREFNFKFMRLRLFILGAMTITGLFYSGETFAGHDDGVSIYGYNGLRGCGCFYHCKCYEDYVSDIVGGGFQLEQNGHPRYLEDKIWHQFLYKFLSAKKGFVLPPDISVIRRMVGGYKFGYSICLLHEYLNVTNEFARMIEDSRIEYIDYFTKKYSKPCDYEYRIKRIALLNERANEALHILSTIPETIIPLFKELINTCPHDGAYNMVPSYTKGLIALLEGDIEKSMFEIMSFLEQANEGGYEHLLNSSVFQKQGEAFLDVGLYNEAIEALNKALEKDPNNHEAYFQRATAYFEIGNFDKSLEDYLSSKKSDYFVPYVLAPNDFIDAFSEATINAAYEAGCDYFPSLCDSLYGIGSSLWALGEHPVDSVNYLASAGYEIASQLVEYLSTVDKSKLDGYAQEAVKLYENSNQLTNSEKGALMGSMIGKYGVDFFAGSATLKGISSFKKLQEANRICNLESMAMSLASKEGIASKGLKHYADRCRFFEKSKIHWDRQNKHIPGKHNYQEGKSIFSHKDAGQLLKNNAGKGTPKRGDMGKPGYQEIIDFKEPIGFWKNKVDSLPTTKGTIHYSKDGAHIVPAHPDTKIW